jgi:hypothetical protein
MESLEEKFEQTSSWLLEHGLCLDETGHVESTMPIRSTGFGVLPPIPR